jgi:hypothetical protein
MQAFRVDACRQVLWHAPCLGWGNVNPKPEESLMYDKPITRIVQQSVLEGMVPARQVADRIGKPYPTLMRELNPFDTGAKLGVETLHEILQVTGDVEVLRTLARTMGYELVRRPAEATGAFEPVMAETRQAA